jgi:hypothetical protein
VRDLCKDARKVLHTGLRNDVGLGVLDVESDLKGTSLGEVVPSDFVDVEFSRQVRGLISICRAVKSDLQVLLIAKQ